MQPTLCRAATVCPCRRPQHRRRRSTCCNRCLTRSPRSNARPSPPRCARRAATVWRRRRCCTCRALPCTTGWRAIQSSTPAIEPLRMSAFVLVHGAWGGAWIWRRVIGPLRAAGHEVHAVTLTGDGERAHLRRPDIGLRTHIDDVLGLIDAEELKDITLVGHSYAGQVITGVADALLAHDAGALRQLVYVDAMVPLPGEGWGSNHAPETVASRQALAAANDNALPP